MLALQLYGVQQQQWPAFGRHIMAQADTASVVVYQAFSPEIADYAVNNQRFGGPFSFTRMSWIKPNFLWMMFRSGWATKHGQERVLAVRIERSFFDGVLSKAIHSNFEPNRFQSREQWREQLHSSEVRLQWDPDHDPSGAPVERRAIQLGLRGSVLKKYATSAIVSLLDITDFVVSQRANAVAPYERLETPLERPFVPQDATIYRSVGLDEL
jgi:hypothetical protein